jgi:hypothetical protein
MSDTVQPSDPASSAAPAAAAASASSASRRLLQVRATVPGVFLTMYPLCAVFLHSTHQMQCRRAHASRVTHSVHSAQRACSFLSSVGGPGARPLDRRGAVSRAQR